MTTPQTIAVLTGDLINSTALGPAGIDRAIDALRDAAIFVESIGICGPLHFTRHRGDGWQVVLDNPRFALRVVVYFRATLRAIDADSYVGIAEGVVDHVISPNLNAESAEVFSVSGRALEIAKTSEHHINYSRLGAYEATAILLNRICKEWTTVQAETVAAVLGNPNDDGPVVTKLAVKIGKSRQTITKTLDAAWFREIDHALKLLESSYDD